MTTGSGNDVINYSQRINNNLSTSTGNDTINSGFGQDNVDGGEGSDLLIVDYSSNTYNEQVLFQEFLLIFMEMDWEVLMVITKLTTILTITAI